MSVVIYDKDGNRSLCDPMSLKVQLDAGFTLEYPVKKVKVKAKPVEAEEPSESDFDREAAIAALKAAGKKVRSNTGDAKIKEMIEALEGK